MSAKGRANRRTRNMPGCSRFGPRNGDDTTNHEIE
ncbi:hypothetical protein Rrhod_3791 [Rhodococcus rhodnii LMG 5362]|uniref:Uncharacterized protein n=1 Tax=Rhodococcus rhodnii LMG 5362 TaxID=1273125 RepID=R7WLP3_9NOCA|nr:hypothetical protein Rrhod_3791 [Rhodococcus rhodnii LMG 5362]